MPNRLPRTATLIASLLFPAPGFAEPPRFSGFATECKAISADQTELEFGTCASEWYHIEYSLTAAPVWFSGKSIDYVLGMVAKADPGFEPEMIAGIALLPHPWPDKGKYPPFALSRSYPGFCIRSLTTPRIAGKVVVDIGGAPEGDGRELVTRCFADVFARYVVTVDFFPKHGTAPIADEPLIFGMMSALY